jgi:hypothetical protein
MATPLIELWHHGPVRCLVTPQSSAPPFCVDIHDGDKWISHREFQDHDSAVEAAVKASRRYIEPRAASAS